MIPSLPKSVLTEFGEKLHTTLNRELKPVVDELIEKDRIKSVIYDQVK